MRMIYSINGLFAAMGAIALVSRVTTATATCGTGYETNAILCVVVGGTSLKGGKGSVLRTMLGVILITLLGNCMNLLGLSTYMQSIMRGAVLVIAIFFGLFASIVASQARITQLSGEIDDAKSELTNAQSYNDYLSTTMDQITNSTSVQQEAEDRLGLVKMDPSQVTYVRLEDESVIERAAGTADKFFAGMKTAALSLLGSFDP